MSHAGCPDREQLHDYLTGSLSPQVAEEVMAHVGTCAACEETLKSLDDADDPLVALLRRPVPVDLYAEEPQRAVMFERVKAMTGGSSASEGGRQDERPDEALSPLGDLGEYRLLAKLGQGGMGAVYKALHTRLDRVVALKVLPKDRTADPQAIARFEREMKAVGRLNHPNIVQAYDARDIEGTTVLVMEYVDGLDFAQLVREVGPLRVADACELVRQAALGLQYAHDHGLVHRDIKPSNLMLTLAESSRQTPCAVRSDPTSNPPRNDPGPNATSGADGTRSAPATMGHVKILDLGLALLGTEQPDGGELTGTGQTMGTADYMAPEQATDSHNVDIRADIYSLGCTLYKLLTGRAPFSGPEYKTPLAKLVAHVSVATRSIRLLRSDVPEELAEVIDRMMAKDPAQRFAAPADVAEALSSLSFWERAGVRGSSTIQDKAGTATPAIADLARLLAEAQHPAEVPALADKSLTGTEPFHSSALVGTQPGDAPKRPSFPVDLTDHRLSGREMARASRPLSLWERVRAFGPLSLWERVRLRAFGRRPAARASETPVAADLREPMAKPVRRRWSRTAIACGAIPMAVLLGIVLWINHNGRRTKLDVPDGSHVQIQPDGSVEVRLPEQGHPLTPGPPAKVAPTKVEIRPELRSWRLQEPMGSLALVAKPTPIPGVLSWTIETRGHRGDVCSVVYSPDGRLLATGGVDGTIRLWDPATGTLICAFVIGEPEIRAVGWSPDGKYLAGGGRRDTRVWDVNSRQLLRTLRGPPLRGRDHAVRSVAFSPDGSKILSGGDRGLHLWDVASGELLWVNESDISGLVWSPDGKMFASGGDDKVVNLWDTETCMVRRTLTGAGNIQGLAWSPDGKIVAAASTPTSPDPESGLQLWHVETGRPLGPLPETRGDVYCVAWSRDGRTLAAGFYNRICWWDVAAAKLIDSVKCVAPGKLMSMSCSSSGKTWAWGAQGGTVWLYSLASKLQTVIPGHMSSHLDPVFSPDGKMLASGKPFFARGTETVRLWQIEPPGMSRQLDGPMDGLGYGMSDWSADGRLLAGKFAGLPSAHVWNIESGKRVATVPASPSDAWIALSPDGQILATQGDSVTLWDVASGRRLRKFDISGSGPQSFSPGSRRLRWSPDGKALAAATDTGVAICNPDTGTIQQTLVGAQVPVTLVAWAPDGKTLAATGYLHEKVYVWDVPSGRLLHTGPETGAIALHWLHDSKTLILGTWHFAHVWNAESRKLLRTIDGAVSMISGDGRLLGYPFEGMIRVRRASDGKPLSTLLSLENEQYAVVSPEGHYTGSPGVEKQLIYVVHTHDGAQLTFTPEEFAAKYGWKNDAGKAEGGEKKAEGGTGGTPVAPGGHTAEATPPAAEEKTVQPTPKPAVAPIQIKTEPVIFAAGEPLNDWALVSNPAPLAGVRWWTAELAAHRGAVLWAAFSPDGSRLATAGAEGNVLLWDPKAGRLVRAILGQGNMDVAFAWSPDGRYLAAMTGSDDLRSICIWEVASGALVRRLPTNHAGARASALAWSPDGRTILTGYAGPIDLLEPDSGKVVPIVAEGQESRYVRSLAWSPDGRSFAVSRLKSDSIEIWDSSSRKMRTTLTRTGPSPFLAWLPDGNHLASFAEEQNGSVRIWNADTGQCEGVVSNENMRRPTSIVCSPDGASLTWAGYGEGATGMIRQWDVPRGKAIPMLFPNELGPVSSAAYSPDSRTLAMGEGDGTVRLYRRDSGWQTLSKGACPLGPLTFSPDAKTLAYATVDGRVSLWPTSQAAPPRQFKVAGATAGVQQGRDGGMSWALAGLLATTRNSQVLVWNEESSELVSTVNFGSESAICSIDLSPDGSLLARHALSSQGPEVFDIKSHKLASHFETKGHGLSWPTKGPFKSAWSPDGKSLAAGVVEGVAIFDSATGKLAQRLTGCSGNPCLVAWSPDGKLVAAANSERKQIWVWDLASGKLTHELVHPMDPYMRGLQWSNDGKALASTSLHGGLAVWDISSGGLLRSIPLRGAPMRVNQYVFPIVSPGMRLLAHPMPSAIRLCQIEDGRALRTLLTLPEGRYAMFTPEGHYTGSPGVEKQLVYVVHTREGAQLTFAPEEFAAKYGWKNDPGKAGIAAGQPAGKGPEIEKDKAGSQSPGE
jgi:WD40 repeat protein/serine/threonine protein kinase